MSNIETELECKYRNLADKHYTLACHADSGSEADRHERLAQSYESKWQKLEATRKGGYK